MLAEHPTGGADEFLDGADVTVERSGVGMRVRLRGDLDVSTVPELRTRFLRAVARNDGPVEVDLREVGYLASAGISLLLEAAVAELRLSTPPGSPAERVLGLAGLSGLVGPADLGGSVTGTT